jgi:carbon monoxide dehydrogenase subunit G
VKVAGSYAVPVSPDRAYSLLQDPVVLARCMPGCDRLEKVGEDEYEMKMKVVLASISGLFAGKVRLADQQFPASFRLIVEGSGKIGFLKGEGLLTLSGHEQGAEVRYDGEVQVGGTIAGVGQRLLDTTAKTIIKRFFKKFSAGANCGDYELANAADKQ